MSDVILTIGGRAYTVACGAGEEGHISELGQIIADKLSTMPGAGGKNDSRSLLFAALLLADELHELRSSKPGKPSIGTEILPPAQLEALAERLEALADALEIPA